MLNYRKDNNGFENNIKCMRQNYKDRKRFLFNILTIILL